MLIFAFTRTVLKNKRIDHISNIKLKRCDSFTESFTISFSNAGKTETLPELEFERFQITIFWRLYVGNIYIVIANDSDFKQAYKFCKFYPIKQTCLIARIPYLA